MQPTIDTHNENDLRRYAEVMWRRKWIVVVAGAVVTIVAVLVSVRQTPRYRATAEVLLQQSQVEELLATTSRQSRLATNRVGTEIGVIESATVRDAVAEQLNRTPRVSVSAKGETDIIQISAESETPAEAASEANTYATTYVQWKQQNAVNQISDALNILNTKLNEARQQLSSLQSAGTPPEDPQIQGLQAQAMSLQQQIGQLSVGQQLTNTGGAQVVSEAAIPSSPFEPQPVRNGALGLPLGLMLGIGLVFLFETFDDRIRSKEDPERLSGLPTLGLVPKVARPKDGRPPLIALDEPTAPAAEAFRSLRTSVKFLGVDERIRTVLVTSSAASDGKTMTAANFAVALAQAGERVLVIGADLRRPRLHEYFGAPVAPGLTNILLGDAPVGAAIYDVAELPGLHVMTSGPTPPNPSELLGGKHARMLFAELAETYDTVVIDSPPVLPVTDAQVLSGIVDITLVVVAYEETSKRSLTRALELLQQVDAPLAGTVLNMVPWSKTYAGTPYRYETYRSRSERRRRRDVRPDDSPAPQHAAGTAARETVPAAGNGDGDGDGDGDDHLGKRSTTGTLEETVASDASRSLVSGSDAALDG